ncbi:MAG: 4Fe-4S binding protein [Candidatus Poseidoniaceae archaeon]
MMMSTGTNMAQLEFVVDDDRCYGCGACIGLCPTNALSMKELLAIVEQELCTYCDHCIPSCPVDALEILGR